MDVGCDTPESEKLSLKEVEKEGLAIVEEFSERMKTLWIDFGIDENRMAKRTKVVWGHMRNLLQEIYDEESYFYQNLQVRVTDFTRQIKEHSKILDVKVSDVEGSLVQREEQLRLELDKLNKLKHYRLKSFHHLKATETRYCKVMGLKLQSQCSSTKNFVPSESDLNDLKQRVTALKEEKDRRHKKFHLVKRSLTTILEETELESETSFEKAILSGKEESFLSDDTFKALEEAICKAEKKREDIRIRKENLMEQLMVVWQKLKVDDITKAEFVSSHVDCNLSVVKSMEKELAQREQEWREKLGNELDTLKYELHELWLECYVSEAEMNLFLSSASLKNTEDEIEAYRTEITVWQTYSKNVKLILNMISMWKTLWDELVAFETKATDPNRFKNKNWNMLWEEKERKRLQKELPFLEEQIFSEIESYEIKHSNVFKYFGEDFRVYVNQLWSSRINEKENKKNERRLSSKFKDEVDGATKRSVMTTPAHTPMRSTSRLSSYHTPLSSIKSNPGRSVLRSCNIKDTPKSSRKVQFGKDSMSCLACPDCGEKKKGGLFERNKHRCPVAPQLQGAHHNTTTYSEFVETLSNSNKTNLQSSVLLRKAAERVQPANGTSSTCVTPKSSRCVGKTTPKFTPLRGKLGLPFLL